MTMNTGCPKCDTTTLIGMRDLCPKHKLEYLKWVADTAQNEYLEELRKQSRKGTQTEREQDAKRR